MATDGKVTIPVTIPTDMKVQLEGLAKAENLSTAAFIRNKLATYIGFDVSGFTSRVPKYASDEERKAAMAAKQTERNSLVKALLEAYKAGKINLG
jgi:hypothetical protein